MHVWALGLSRETPAASGPPGGPGLHKSHQKITRRQIDTKRAKWWRERKKKRGILGPPPFGAPPFGPHPSRPHPSGPHYSGTPPFGPHPSGPHPSRPHPSGPHPSRPHPSGPHYSGTPPFGAPPFGAPQTFPWVPGWWWRGFGEREGGNSYFYPCRC